jgi:IS5 family transposase
MTQVGAYQPLFKEINRQLEAHKIIVKTGALVEPSVIDTSLKPKGEAKHKVTEDRKDQEGLVLGVLTTKASRNEIANLEDVLDTADLPEGISLKADKGYQSKKNGEVLKNHIMKKAKKKQPISHWEKMFNKIIGKTRFKVECTFGCIKRWFSGSKARYRGIERMHTQNLMEPLCYNLYRSPGIIASNCKN